MGSRSGISGRRRRERGEEPDHADAASGAVRRRLTAAATAAAIAASASRPADRPASRPSGPRGRWPGPPGRPAGDVAPDHDRLGQQVAREDCATERGPGRRVEPPAPATTATAISRDDTRATAAAAIRSCRSTQRVVREHHDRQRCAARTRARTPAAPNPAASTPGPVPEVDDRAPREHQRHQERRRAQDLGPRRDVQRRRAHQRVQPERRRRKKRGPLRARSDRSDPAVAPLDGRRRTTASARARVHQP